MRQHAEPIATTEHGNPCVTCQPKPDRQPRIARQGWVCDGCRSRLANNLREIADLYAELANPETLASEDGWDIHGWDLRNRKDPRTGHDPASYVAPAANIAGQKPGGRVSGSREGHSPINLTVHDLTSVARRLGVTRDGQREWDGESDQIGDLAVASTLDGWVRDWRDVRGRGEHLPEPTVPTLVQWLLVRLDWACDEHAAIDEMADGVFRLRGRLRSVAGLVDVPDYKRGIPCRRCDMRTLVQRAGSDWVECTNCDQLMSPDDYEAWTRLLSKADKDDLRAQYAPTLD